MACSPTVGERLVGSVNDDAILNCSQLALLANGFAGICFQTQALDFLLYHLRCTAPSLPSS